MITQVNLLKWRKLSFLLVTLFFLSFPSFSQQGSSVLVLKSASVIHPLDEVTVVCQAEGTLTVTDSKGREYFKTRAFPKVVFTAAGAAGTQKITVYDKKGKNIATATFNLEAPTNINDGGKINELYKILYNGMMWQKGKGYSEVKWRDKSYKFYVPWVLDNNNVMSGIQYFSPYGADLTDLMRENQKPDGMIWSFVRGGNADFSYYQTAYSSLGYFKHEDKDSWFVRQPVENHPEYNYVNMFYKHWKASGDNEWMKKTLDCAAKALDYCVTDTLRWSKRFQLLKRPYCIDSWDFQVDDEYTPQGPVSPTMVIVPGKTKFGVFFGDNTGYFEACNQLAEMFDYAGQPDKANIYRKRGEEIMKRLTDLAWNGKYFIHFIDEDPTVKRNLGVDEKSQIAQGNMYSINRGLPKEICVNIINTYQKLKENLPAGSPGEWYAIYPPFERGFGGHNEKWQYMNAGIAGHGIGELARGAYEVGYEDYASDILYRTLDLCKKYNNKIYFAYTGAFPPTPVPTYKTVDISAQANMDLWDKGGKNIFNWMADTRSGNDMRGLPVGDQVFENIKFRVTDPAKNQRKAAIVVANKAGFPKQVQVAIKDTAQTVYLLHTSSGGSPSNVAGAVTFIYADGTEASKYIIKGKDITNWWFPSLKSETAGVAWSGPNEVCSSVGVCWAAIANPNPKKVIAKIQINAALEGGLYSVMGITLSDKVHYVKPSGESYGGPDNWAAANAMAALVEGLAGVKNTGLAFDKVKLSPRWTSSAVDSVDVTINFPASNGYIKYNYQLDKKSKEISLKMTGSGNELQGHVLLPKNVNSVKTVSVNGQPLAFQVSKIENSQYVDFTLPLPSVQAVKISYE